MALAALVTMLGCAGIALGGVTLFAPSAQLPNWLYSSVNMIGHQGGIILLTTGVVMALLPTLHYTLRKNLHFRGRNRFSASCSRLRPRESRLTSP